MNKLLIGVLASLLLALTWLALRPSGGSPQNPATDQNRSLEPKQSEPAELQAVATQTELLAAGEPASSAAERAAVAGVEVPNNSPEAGEGARQAEGVAGLRGLFLLPDGSPARDVALRVHGWLANSERELQFGKPAAWQDPEGTSDVEGRFFIPFEPPRAYQFTLSATLPGYSHLRWRWSSLPGQEITDVGDVVLVAGGRVRGHLRNSRGQVLTGEWYVLADSLQPPNGAGRVTTHVSADVDATSGEFLLEGLPPGRAEVHVSSRNNESFDGGEVDVRAGEETALELIYDQRDHRDRIRLVAHVEFYNPLAALDPKSLRLKDAAGAALDHPVRAAGNSLLIEGLQPGTYGLELRDPRFQPWEKPDIESGSTVHARLRGSAALRLSVRDAEGRPVQNYRLCVSYAPANFLPNRFELRALGQPAPAGELYRGLMPSSVPAQGAPASTRNPRSREELVAAMEAAMAAQASAGHDRMVIEVSAPGLATGFAEISGLAANEVREIELTLLPEASIDGRISGRAPGDSAGVSVVLAAAALGFQAAREYRADGSGSEQAGAPILETECDQDGGFRFSGLAEGSYVLVARFNREFQAPYGPFQVRGGQTTETLIDAAGHASIQGQLRAAPADLEGAWIEALAQAPSGQPIDPLSGIHRLPRARAQVNDGGHFLLAPLAPGTYHLYWHHSPGALAQDRKLWRSRFQQAPLLGSVHLPGAHRVDVEFDLSAERRGQITCQATINGEPAIGWRVEARPASPEHAGTRPRAEARTGPGGVAHLELLQPGAWKIALVDHDGLWRAWAPAPVDLEPGGEISLQIETLLHAGQLLLLDASNGQPRSNQYVYWGQGEERIPLKTDSQGRLDLRLPAGAYTIQAYSSDSGELRSDVPATPLEWTPSGPQTAVLRL